jgi:hypothetical protein
MLLSPQRLISVLVDLTGAERRALAFRDGVGIGGLPLRTTAKGRKGVAAAVVVARDATARRRCNLASVPGRAKKNLRVRLRTRRLS